MKFADAILILLLALTLRAQPVPSPILPVFTAQARSNAAVILARFATNHVVLKRKCVVLSWDKYTNGNWLAVQMSTNAAGGFTNLMVFSPPGLTNQFTITNPPTPPWFLRVAAGF